MLCLFFTFKLAGLILYNYPQTNSDETKKCSPYIFLHSKFFRQFSHYNNCQFFTAN